MPYGATATGHGAGTGAKTANRIIALAVVGHGQVAGATAHQAQYTAVLKRVSSNRQAVTHRYGAALPAYRRYSRCGNKLIAHHTQPAAKCNLASHPADALHYLIVCY